MWHMFETKKVFPEQDMHGGARKPFFAAEGMAYLHEKVVDDDGEVIGGHAVRFEEHLVIYGGRIKCHFTADHIGESYLLVGLEFYTHYIRRAGFEQGLCFGRIDLQRVAHLFAEGMVVLGGGVFA